jgi:hypothetical protein
LVDWDGQLTERARDLAGWHIEECQTCANRGSGALRPAALFGLLPLAPLPPELREQVLSRCSSTAEDAVVYRRQVVRRAESTWLAIFAAFSQAIRRLSWDSIRANPGVAVATTAVAVWVVAAVSVTLLTFAGPPAAHAHSAQPTGSHAVHARAAQTSVGTHSGSPSAAPATATAPTFAAATPSPTVTQPSAHVSSSAQPSPSPSRSTSSSPSKSPSPTA